MQACLHAAGSIGAVIHAQRPRTSAAERSVLALIVLVGVGLPLAIRLLVGVVPGNDEWSFAKAALAMHAHHDVALQGFNQMFLVGQLVAAQPFLAAFGAHVATLAGFGAATAVLWLGTAFALTRPMVGTRGALVLVGVLIAFPGFGLLSSSFMTDVPSTATALLALYVGVRAFETASAWRLLAAFALAVVSFTFREQAVVLFAIFLVTACVFGSTSRAFRTTAIVGSVVCVIGCSGLELLRHGVPNGDTPPFGLGSIHALGAIEYPVRAVFTIALALSPLIVASAIRRGLRPPSPGLAMAWGAVVATACVLLAVQPHSVLMGNYLEWHGAYPTAMVGAAAPAFGLAVWVVVQCLAVLAAAVMCGELGAGVRRWRRRGIDRNAWDVRRFMVYSYGALASAVYVVLAFLGERQYDRYLLPVLLVVGVLILRTPRDRDLLRPPPGRRRVILAPALCAAFLLMVSLSLTLTTDVRDRAVWRSAQRLTGQGVPATAINAGSDWDGMHAATALVRGGVTDSNVQYVGDMWAQFFPGSGDCYAVTLSPMDATVWRLVRVAWARPYGTQFGAAPVYTYRRTDGRPFGHVSC